MGYRVDYPPVKKLRGQEKRRYSRAALTGLCLMLFFLLVNALWPRGAQLLRDILIPGDGAVTAAALEELAMDLRTGEPLSGALSNFLKTVVLGD